MKLRARRNGGYRGNWHSLNIEPGANDDGNRDRRSGDFNINGRRGRGGNDNVNGRGVVGDGNANGRGSRGGDGNVKGRWRGGERNVNGRRRGFDGNGRGEKW